MRSRASSNAEGSRRRSSRHSSHTFLHSFDEPVLADDGNPALKTTGQGLADFPDDGALTSLIDPDRSQRQQSRVTPKVTRRPPRSVNENGNVGHKSGHAPNGKKGPQEEKLFLRLKRNLATDPETEYSDIRETPVKGIEDYRHNRIDHNTADDQKGSRKRRRNTSDDDAQERQTTPSRRARRSTRPAVYEYETSVDPSDASKSLSPDPEHYDSDADSRPGNKKNQSITAVSASANGTHKNGKQAGNKRGDSVQPDGRAADHHIHNNQSELKQEVKAEVKPKGIVNNDYCNSCGGTGELLCCETCVRSFHFSCIEPPVMSVEEIPEDEWSCRHCRPIQLGDNEKKAVSKTLFSSLIFSLECHNAVAYQLPTHVRELFAHVQTSKYGEYADEYMKTDHIAAGPRIQDKAGNTLLCFKCKNSALRGKNLAVCSQCQQAWHIDCVDPPLESTPLGYWVCPLHAGNSIELPLRVKKPTLTPVGLKRSVPNNGDIEIEDEEDDGNDKSNSDSSVSRMEQEDREDAGSFSDEEVTRNIAFPAQSRMLPNGMLVAKSSRLRHRSLDSDRVVYKLPPRTIKLDFLEAVHKRREEPLKETPTADFLLALDYLAEKPQLDREAVRNLMHLKLQGPAVSTATAKENLSTLLDAALTDENELGQIAAIRKLMKEKGKERLLSMLSTST